ncbi:hypothetical protein BG74_00335 [Sodalis-like endosymbiont of Proechinophthirus fluctus]|uniref:hypothetical protein n=1 Tax=Sodalis-like endosymbiont of Proechinophthirus fluctus TaxID=1462730 RepID=UPI0007A84E26|nr:hypothetical protein [Sodalis-like endosymbiont of Proechinophthirus fluctus]KYP97758.1 hypothetical protein BG74_00335 [Sodalis-like endosymbiont of Proechinophthirus fluctus]
MLYSQYGGKNEALNDMALLGDLLLGACAAAAMLIFINSAKWRKNSSTAQPQRGDWFGESTTQLFSSNGRVAFEID